MKELFSTGSGILGISFDIGYYPGGKWQNSLLSLAHGVTGHNEGTLWQTLIALRDRNVLSIDLFFDVRERRRKGDEHMNDENYDGVKSDFIMALRIIYREG